MGAGFDRSCHGLKPVHIRSLEGLLFVCLADEPPADFDEMAARLGPYIAPHNIRGTKVAFQSRHHRARQLEADDGEQPRVLSLRGEPSRTDRAALRLRLRLLARGDGRDGPRAMPSATPACWSTSTTSWEADGLPSREIDELDTMGDGISAPSACRSTARASRTRSTPGRPAASSSANSTSAKLGGLHRSGRSRTPGTISWATTSSPSRCCRSTPSARCCAPSGSSTRMRSRASITTSRT